MAQSQPPLPFTSLNAATATGSGVVKDLEGAFKTHTVAVWVTGSPSSVLVQAEGSHDGVNWFGLGTINFEGSNINTATSHLFRYVRANLVTLSGGSSPTVTATIASA